MNPRLKLKARVDALTLKGVDIFASAASGRLRVFDGTEPRVELSNTLSSEEMRTWLDGFEAALRLMGKL